MSVKKEASGRRSVQVEVEVPGTPEEVWQAIATGPGISSWFVPTEFEERDGKPVAVKLNFGPGMEPRCRGDGLGSAPDVRRGGRGLVRGSPPIATEWSVEARAGGVCVVRVVHSLFASTDDWDNQLEGTESGWPGFFRILRLYLTHFRGQRSALMQWMAPAAGTEAEAWETLTAALGLKGVSVGQRWTAPAGVPALGGVVEPVNQNPYDALLRLDKPGPGVAALGAVNFPAARHGGDQFLPLWRSGGRNRRPRDAAVAGVDPGTFPDADGTEQERMRKLKIIEHISLDGVIQDSGDDGDFPYGDWTAPYRTPAGRDMVMAAHGERFDLVLGRRTYDIWSGFWPKAPSSPMADRLNAATKYVATHRPESLEWGPFEGIGPDIVEGIRRIKSQDGPDLILSGSSTLTSTVLEHGLADEVLLIVYPVLLGTGKRLFADGTPAHAFELVNTQTTPSGVILTTYKVVGPLKTA